MMGDKEDSGAVEKAFTAASAASGGGASGSGQDSGVLLGYEACGKSAKLEARDYFEMIVSAVLSLPLFCFSCFFLHL